MQGVRSVGINHPFWVSSCSRSVTNSAGSGFFYLYPIEVSVLFFEQFLVAEQIGDCAFGHVIAVSHNNDFFDGL